MQSAQDELRRQYVSEASDVYIDNCAVCHGSDGQGIGVMPPLNTLGQANADPGMLYDTIARAAHGTAMASWHLDEGGVLDEYQIEGLVTLLRYGDWEQVRAVADTKGFIPPAVEKAYESDAVLLENVPADDPHQCKECHEDPEVHLDQFGLDCSRCHVTAAWVPAQLTRHLFRLDHGGEGKVACETCHQERYDQHTCYGCHDHQPDEMQEVHAQEDILEFEACAQCHPTGVEGEGTRYRVQYPKQAPSEDVLGGLSSDQDWAAMLAGE
jgi:mono/diheme cytochrome c family protein